MSQTTHRRMTGFKLILVGSVMAVASMAAVTVWAYGPTDGPGAHGMMMGNPERIGRMADHMLDGLNATDAQRAQVRQIAQAAAADLKAQREAARGLHEKGLQAFAAPTIDAAAAEALRQQMQAQFDQGSKRMLQAMLDIGRVLTPEQRAKLAERWKQRGEMMHDRMQRMHHGEPQKG